jgi:tetratricopeptide (TPR) repeat protein
MQLGPLHADASAALLALATEEAPLPPHQASLLVERAGGNPLFLVELAAAVRESGGVGGLPDSIGSVVTARIDHLAPRERDILRRSSVLGPSFDAALLSSVLDETPSWDDPAWERLAGFLRRDDGTVSFVQNLIRDVAYEGLPFRLRRDLHAHVGEALELRAEDPDQDAERLSLHFVLARRFDRAWRYARIAGAHASARLAPADAARLYRRALEAARSLRDLDPVELAAVWEELGDVSERTGDFPGADGALATARRLLAERPLDCARLWLKQAWIPERTGRYAQAIVRMGRARALVERIESEEAARLGAQLAAGQAAVRQMQGRSNDAVRWCRRAIGEAEFAGSRDALAHAYFILDWALFDLGRMDQVGYSERALEIYEELGDLGRQAVVLNNMGGMAYWEGRWDEAVELYERGRDARLRTGDHVNAASGTFNIGEIRSDQGRLGEADALFRDALRVWQAAGDRPGIAFAMAYLGRVASRDGRFDEAEALFAVARGLFGEVGADGEVLQADAFVAECDVLRGRWSDALRVAEDALSRSATIEGGGAHGPLLHRVRGYALAQRGDVDGARAEFDESLRTARSRNADYEVALALQALERLAEREGSAVDPEVAVERRAVFDRLGVVGTPSVPLAP